MIDMQNATPDLALTSTGTATIRTPKRNGYTVVPNGVLPEGKISARSWGLYVYLLSRPPGWEIRTSQLQKVFAEGRDAIYTALKGLVAADLMRLESYRTPEGLPRKRYVMIAPEESLKSPNTGFQDTGNQDPEKAGVTTTDLSQSGSKSLQSSFTSNVPSDKQKPFTSTHSADKRNRPFNLDEPTWAILRQLIQATAKSSKDKQAGGFHSDDAQDTWATLQGALHVILNDRADLDLLDDLMSNGKWTIGPAEADPYEAGIKLTKLLNTVAAGW